MFIFVPVLINNSINIVSMKNISKFINKAQEQRFNDALMNVVITEIRLKSGILNEEMILPCNNKGIYYNGEFYEQSAMIKDLVPQKALLELKALVETGSKLNFENKQQIKNWIVNETEIKDCSLAVFD